MTIDIRCNHCGRYLGSCEGSIRAKLKCANCKALEEYHIVALSHYIPTRTTLGAVHEAQSRTH